MLIAVFWASPEHRQGLRSGKQTRNYPLTGFGDNPILNKLGKLHSLEVMALSVGPTRTSRATEFCAEKRTGSK